MSDLDLGASIDSASDCGMTIDSDNGSGGGSPASPYAIEQDAWSIRKGSELAVTEHFCERSGWDFEKHGNDEDLEHLATDLRTAAFDFEPQLTENCSNDTHQQFVQKLLETPEWDETRNHTVMQPWAASMAAAEAAEQYTAFADSVEPDGKGSGKGKGEADGEGISSDLKATIAASRAARAAKKQAESVADACRGLGGNGGIDGMQDPANAVELYKRIRGSKMLRKIFDKAGAWQSVGQDAQRKKPVHGHDQMVGIERGGDLARVTKTFLSTLVDDDMGDMAVMALIEKTAPSRKFESVEPVGKGPVVVVVDESGSMRGERIENAKALALSAAWIAKQQRRWIAFVSFAGGTSGKWVAFPPDRWDESALLDWLEHFYGGGTTCDVPLVELPDNYWQEFEKLGMQRGETDVIMVTDAIVNVPSEVIDNFNAWKEAEKVRVQTIIIGHGKPGDLAKVSDEVHSVGNINTECEAGRQVLSF